MAFRNPLAEKMDYKDIHPILFNKYLLWTFHIDMYL